MDDLIIEINKAFTELELEAVKIKRKVNKSINRLSTIKALIHLNSVRRTLPTKPKAEPEVNMHIPKRRVIRNMETTSMRNTLPKLGLRPTLTAEWLLKEGYLMFAPRIGTDGVKRKIPTVKGRPYFTAEHTNGLYINGLGCNLLSRLKEHGVIPTYCHTTVRQ